MGVREIHADVLAAIAAAGGDVGYILTGRRSADALDEEDAEFLGNYLELPESLRDLARSFIRTMKEKMNDGSPHNWVLRERQSPYGAGNGS